MTLERIVTRRTSIWFEIVETYHADDHEIVRRVVCHPATGELLFTKISSLEFHRAG